MSDPVGQHGDTCLSFEHSLTERDEVSLSGLIWFILCSETDFLKSKGSISKHELTWDFSGKKKGGCI